MKQHLIPDMMHLFSEDEITIINREYETRKQIRKRSYRKTKSNIRLPPPACPLDDNHDEPPPMLMLLPPPLIKMVPDLIKL